VTAHAKPLGRVMVIAGSDSGAGAGIQADIKTVMALGGYATTAITALTAQNTEGVFDVSGVPPSFVTAQIRAVMDDIGADCWKLGMLHDGAVVEAVSALYEEIGENVPLVMDPVMLAKSGHSLLEPAALDLLKHRLLPQSFIVTPNVPEAELLLDIEIRSPDDMKHAAESMMSFGSGAVLLKGGHLDGPVVCDVLCSSTGTETFEAARIDSRHTHGTGCTLASAIATGLALGLPITKAVTRGRAYLLKAMLSTPRLGRGNGPMNHAHTLVPFDVDA
jgi:hydroxymethylpyrimidine/phosphomethylpyrimidine kinase